MSEKAICEKYEDWCGDVKTWMWGVDPDAPSVTEVTTALRKASGYVSDGGDLIGAEYLDNLASRLEQ